jgi:transcriptional regulator with XRE-family HTH domain
MTEYAERIRRLREKTGMTDTEMASLLGMDIHSYGDLEMHDDELTTSPSIREVKLLANILGVSTVHLLAEENVKPELLKHISYEDLVTLTKGYITSNCTSQDEFENKVGWYLDGFFSGQDTAWDDYSIDFLMDLCGVLGLNWLETLPI